jgi:hypothetical protein
MLLHHGLGPPMVCAHAAPNAFAPTAYAPPPRPRARRPADTEGIGALAQTEFAKHWKWLINKNAFFQPFMVNFGAIGEGARASAAADADADAAESGAFIAQQRAPPRRRPRLFRRNSGSCMGSGCRLVHLAWLQRHGSRLGHGV